MQDPGKERYSDGACEVNRRQKWRISRAPSRWMIVAELRSFCRSSSCVFERKATFSFKDKDVASLSLLCFFPWLHTTLWLYIRPELGLIVNHLHLPCHKLHLPFFSPPPTPDAAISVNPFAPRGGSLSCGGVSARRESSSFRFHFLSVYFSSSHFFRGYDQSRLSRELPTFLFFQSTSSVIVPGMKGRLCLRCSTRGWTSWSLTSVSRLSACRVIVPENPQFTEQNSAITF